MAVEHDVRGIAAQLPRHWECKSTEAGRLYYLEFVLVLLFTSDWSEPKINK